MNDKVPKLVGPSALRRYETVFEPETATAATRVQGYKLIGSTTEGYPIFEAVKGPVGPQQLVYETPLFEDFIPETFH
jgi:hypothetical protein